MVVTSLHRHHVLLLRAWGQHFVYAKWNQTPGLPAYQYCAGWLHRLYGCSHLVGVLCTRM